MNIIEALSVAVGGGCNGTPSGVNEKSCAETKLILLTETRCHERWNHLNLYISKVKIVYNKSNGMGSCFRPCIKSSWLLCFETDVFGFCTQFDKFLSVFLPDEISLKHSVGYKQKLGNSDPLSMIFHST